MASKIIKNVMQGHMSLAILNLLEATNSVTTLEVKTELRKSHPEFSWLQKDVSAYMDSLQESGDLTYEDNGTFRIYHGIVTKAKKAKKAPAKVTKAKFVSVKTPSKVVVKTPTVKAKRISKTKAMELMIGNKGHFFTAEFEKKNGDLRVMNCQALKKQTSKLGYITVKEASQMRKDPTKAVRNINLQTITGLRIGGVSYKVN